MTAEPANASKPIPGTTLKCLEDPSFEFDNNTTVENETCANQPPPAKKPAYRVLEGNIILFDKTLFNADFKYNKTETQNSSFINFSYSDPFEETGASDIPSALGAVCNSASDTQKAVKQPNYKILEAGDPMVTSMYDASTSLSQSPTSVTQQ